MIQAFTAHTFELDDPQAAAAEILGQIDIQSLKAHALGILTCYSEFVESGIASAISDALPFDVIGCTTSGTCVAEDLGENMLSLMVLTSDDVSFSAAYSEPVIKEQDAPIAAAYRKAMEGRTGQPAMILAIAPFHAEVGGEIIVESLNRATGGIPMFGTFSIDTSDDLSHNRTFFNGVSSKDSLAIALLFGDLHPRYYVSTIPEEKIQKQRGVVTKSDGNILMGVNNMTLPAYFETIGLDRTLNSWQSISFPFVIDYNDGTKPVARAIFSITEEGYASCGGFMPEGATLSLGGIDYTDVIRTSTETLGTIMGQEGSCLLMFSCQTRYLVLGANTTAEMENVRKIIGGKKEFIFANSGGEICPVYTDSGSTVNRFHNCTFIACLL
jgi:hypothetical protein